MSLHKKFKDTFKEFSCYNFVEPTPDHGWSLWQATRNPDFNRDLLWSQPATLEESNKKLDEFIHLNGQENSEQYCLSILDKKTGEWLGFVFFRKPVIIFNDNDSVMEGGIWVTPSMWGTTLAYRILKLMFRLSFALPNLSQSTAMCYSAGKINPILTKLTMKKIGEHFSLREGQSWVSNYYAIDCATATAIPTQFQIPFYSLIKDEQLKADLIANDRFYTQSPL